VAGTMPRDHPEIMHHHEGFDFVPGNRSLSAVEVGLVNVMSRETVLRQYVDSVKRDYDYVLLDCRPSLGIMVDSNLQRERVLPSEKAFAYKMKLDAMRRQQGERTDLTSVPLGQKLGKTSREQLADKSPDSNTQIQRYIRLTNLIPEILEMVDNSVLKEKGTLQMALRPAVELSYLPENEQNALLEVMEGEDCTPSHAQAIKIRDFSEKGKLNPDVILSIMQEEKPNQVEQFKMPRNRIDKFFPVGTPAQKIEDTIVKALEMYRRRERGRER